MKHYQDIPPRNGNFRRSDTTPRQLWIHAYMLRWQKGHNGLPPTMREIMAATGINSTNAIVDAFASMQKRGLLVKQRGMYVAI